MGLKIKKKKRQATTESTETKSTTRKKSIVSKGNGSWYNKGYEPVRRNAEANKKKKGGFALELWIKADEEAIVRFMVNEPINIHQHSIQIGGRWQTRTCIADTGEKCPLCAMGNKRRFVGVYSVIDRRKEEYKDRNGKTIKKRNTVKLWRCGQRVLSTLENINAKRGGLTKCDMSVTRIGEGKDTIYNIIPEIPEALSEKDKEKEKLNLIKVLAPKPRAELLAELGANQDDDEEVTDDI